MTCRFLYARIKENKIQNFVLFSNRVCYGRLELIDVGGKDYGFET